jgi:hypothetical protein
MVNSSSGQDLFLPSFSARGLSLAGLMLLVYFLTILVGVFFPVSLLDPAWQLRLANSLLNSSPVALSGLVLIHLGSTLDRQDRHLLSRREIVSRLAVLPSLGFILLIPLLTSAMLMQRMSVSVQRSANVGRATMELERMQLAVKQATSVEDLDQRLRAINGPRLEPTDRGIPLAQVKQRVQAVLDVVSKEIATNMPASIPVGPSTFTEILRMATASFALAIAFAGLARRRGSDNSFLLEALGAGKQRRPMQVNRAEQPPL